MSDTKNRVTVDIKSSSSTQVPRHFLLQLCVTLWLFYNKNCMARPCHLVQLPHRQLNQAVAGFQIVTLLTQNITT